MYADQWFKFLKVAKSDYIDNYIKYNESRLKFKKKMVKKNDNNEAVEEQLEQLEQVEQVEQLENSETIQES